MLYKQTTTPFLYQTLQDLMKQEEIKPFRLAGGTGLSLQLGHRKSFDINLFSDTEFLTEEFVRFLKKLFPKLSGLNEVKKRFT